MKKKIALALILCTIATMLCGCSTSYEEANLNPNNIYLKPSKGYFTVIKSWHGGIDYPIEYIVYANDTGVMYYVFRGTHYSGITPLYNADGTLQIYEEESYE